MAEFDLFAEKTSPRELREELRAEKQEVTQAITVGPAFENTRDDISVGFTVGYTNEQSERR